MKHFRVLSPAFAASSFVFATSLPATAQTPQKDIASRTTTVDGVRLHYLTTGHGPTVILLHGYTQTSRMWAPIIPRLAERFTVIPPLLPGSRQSKLPADGLDMKTAAVRIHSLA